MATHEVMVTGRFARWMRRRHWTGCCLPVPFYGSLVLYWLSASEEETGPLWYVKVHEETHAAQIDARGPIRFIFAYIWELLRKGYRSNRFELEAYEAERRLATFVTGRRQ